MTEAMIHFALGGYQSAFDSTCAKLRQDHVVERLQARDYTLWKPNPDEIVNRLGWLDTPATTLEKIHYIRAVLEPLLGKNPRDAVLLGIGGSSLAAEVFNTIIGGKDGFPRLHILDTTDPLLISATAQNLDPADTIFLVSSKSGTTLEIISLFKYFYNLALKNGGKNTGSRFVFITDEGSPLVKTAEAISAHFTFFSNSDIGGRFTALSLTGMVPAAVVGINVEKLLQKVVSNASSLMNTGMSLGAALGTLASKGCDKLTLILPPHWKAFGDWLEQLIAESTGKEGKGILPVLDEPVRDQNTFGRDRVFVFFQHGKRARMDAIQSLTDSGHPVITVQINEDDDLVRQMYIWEVATAVAAHIMRVNPFDQPDVEATKKYTRAVITDLDQDTGEKPVITFEQTEIFGKVEGKAPKEILNQFLKQAQAGGYICLQNYLSPSPETDESVNLLRRVISEKYFLPVTCGYGPRYLHSTGQLHKGDSGNGLFIQLTQNYTSDVDIPDNIGETKSSLSFGALKAAQAKGDRQALTEAGRKIIRFHFLKNPAAGLKMMANLLS
jgi:glucose-6-phosphate isomerase/transaldolase/glucose-6-phosphate isomerase